MDFNKKFTFTPKNKINGFNSAIVEITLKNGDSSKPSFSASGLIYNRRKCISAGQNLDEISRYIDTPVFKIIYKMWKKYHLNDMNAGTVKQTKAIDNWIKQGNKYDYTKACEYLKSINLYEVKYKNANYKYGHSWLYHSIPKKDLDIIKSLF
jgi:hypothetical protein